MFLNRFPISVLRYGEVVDVNLVRDKTTGKSRGFAFLAYEDQRSTVLAVGEDSFHFLLKSLPRVV
jgi:RNA recognition motif-containing protein